MKDEVLGSVAPANRGAEPKRFPAPLANYCNVGSAANEGTFTLDLDETGHLRKAGSVDDNRRCVGDHRFCERPRGDQIARLAHLGACKENHNRPHPFSIQYPAISAHGSAVFLAEAGSHHRKRPDARPRSRSMRWKVGQAMQVSTEAEWELAWTSWTSWPRTWRANIATAVDVQLARRRRDHRAAGPGGRVHRLEHRDRGRRSQRPTT